MAYSEKNALDNLNTSQDTQAECKLLNAIRKSNPEFVDEITALAQNAIDIEKSMKAIENLRNIWSGHITTYTKLLWGPHKTPGFTQGFEEITKYQQNIQGDASQVESESMAQGLFALQEDIQVIQQQWTDVVDRYSLGSLQSQGVQAENVSALTATLQSINERASTFSLKDSAGLVLTMFAA
ncbi:hypothetical protein K474DRAFT_80105 [Panus rudis PR-1116 ss-1]|nr:hypothetical protein K474DRAFT_80105 [Panus rudis PR-1116 ss-1]